jgi:cytoskeletal protein CcmA (bactofilin family)
MAIFRSRSKTKEEESVELEEKVEKKPEISERVAIPSEHISRLQYGVSVEGNIKAKGSFAIGGNFKGSAIIEDSIYIEHNANFNGELEAKNVKIAGNFEGKIKAHTVEITKTAHFKGLINATKTFLAGNVKAIIKSKDSLEVLPTGVIEAKEAKSSNIKILGKIHGRVIASELLEVTKGGSIEGTIVTKGIKTEQGGTILGTIQTFDDTVHGVDIEYSLDDVFDDEKVLGVNSITQIEQLSSKDLKKYAKKETQNSNALSAKENS